MAKKPKTIGDVIAKLSERQKEALIDATQIHFQSYWIGGKKHGGGTGRRADAAMSTLRALNRKGLVTAPERYGASGDANAPGRANLTQTGLRVRSVLLKKQNPKGKNMARRRKNQGRHYSIDEAAEFWMHGVAESMGVDPRNVDMTEDVEEAWHKFDQAVEKSLRKHLSASKVEEIYDSEGDDSVTSDVYATITGQGVGIWDGRWDPYLSQTKLDKLQTKLTKDLSKYADYTGGGSLNEAFMEAVVRQANPRKPGCGAGYLKVKRKGYTRKGYVTRTGKRVKPTRVPGTTYCTPDKGKPGRGPKLIPKLKKGTLGIEYSKEPSAKSRRAKLKTCVKKYGYQSCVGKVNALRVLNKNTWPKKWLAMLDSDLKWLQKTYRGKSGGKKNPTTSRKKNPSGVSLRSIMSKALK